jgi:uncharacterized protein (TIGR02996 family)
VTTEEDFQRALDANPEDWQARLVFADWLDERGDLRAEGYRALGRLRLRPYPMDNSRHWWTAEGDGPPTFNHLPPDWFEKVAGYQYRTGRWRWPERWDHRHNNRGDIEDAAALAFFELPAERRAALLATENTGKKKRTQTARKKRTSKK